MENQLSAGRLGQGGTGENTNRTTRGNNNTLPRIRKGSKIHSVLSALVNGRSLNRFEAEKQLNDHTLNSTISEIQNRLGVLIHRETERVSCLGGAKLVDVKRYRLFPSEIEKARRLLVVAA